MPGEAGDELLADHPGRPEHADVDFRVRHAGPFADLFILVRAGAVLIRALKDLGFLFTKQKRNPRS
jgi:hypothetical protein